MTAAPETPATTPAGHAAGIGSTPWFDADVPRHHKKAKPTSKKPWKVERSYQAKNGGGLRWMDGRWMTAGRYETKERAEQAMEQLQKNWKSWSYRIVPPASNDGAKPLLP